jgi:DNA/RNA endonuclease G (NUC1)
MREKTMHEFSFSGIWARLENMIRNWAKKYDVVHVISGTIFDVDNDGIKDKKISTKR